MEVRSLNITYMIVFFLGQRQRVVVEEPEHVVLGHRVHLGVDAGGGREEDRHHGGQPQRRHCQIRHQKVS